MDALHRTARVVLISGAILVVVGFILTALMPDWISGYLLPPSIPLWDTNMISAFVGLVTSLSQSYFALGVVLSIYCRFADKDHETREEAASEPDEASAI